MVETIGEALSLGWQLKARCAFGNREGMKSVRQCTWTYDLDMLTLVATRGRDFPLAMLASRLRCPRCGSRRVAVVFMPLQRATRGDGRHEQVKKAIRGFTCSQLTIRRAQGESYTTESTMFFPPRLFELEFTIKILRKINSLAKSRLYSAI